MGYTKTERQQERITRGLCGVCGRFSLADLKRGGKSRSRCRHCLDRIVAWTKREYHSNPKYPERNLMASIRHKTGLSIAEIRSVWAGRYGKCAVCETPAQETAAQVLSFDHDHSTGRFRGWLCTRCNAFAGYLEGTPELVERLNSYLGRTSLITQEVM